MMPWLKLDPSWLPPGTQVGPWKVTAFHAGGAFGAVFRAILVGRAHDGPVALKLAYSPLDPRFAREAELLSRIHHPSVPKLLGRGIWQPPGGAGYPFLAMEWVDGMPLYDWATRFTPSSREVLRVLAQVARALEATHAVGGLHRDVKGGNILVRATTGQAFLMDYGAGNYAGAQPLTRDGLPPGTDNYRSTEAWDCELHRPRNDPSAYKAQPPDDVFALGVSAFRCVTGTYPPPVDVLEEETGERSLLWLAPPDPRELNIRVAPGLSRLILGMLSERPEQRPTPRELAEALEQASQKPAPSADRKLFEPRPTESRAAEPLQERSKPPDPEQVPARTVWTLARARIPAWMAACAVLAGVLGAATVGWALRDARNGAARGQEPRAPAPVGVGDTGLPAPETPLEDPANLRGVSRPMPTEPFLGQRRAPHCKPPVEVTINGGCWIELPDMKPPCGDLSYEWQGRCYIAHIPPGRAPTSQPKP